MSSETTAVRLARLAADELDLDGVSNSWTPSQRLVEDLGLDSLKLMTLAVAIEDHFRIVLEPVDEQRIGSEGTVAGLIAVIDEKLGEASGHPGRQTGSEVK